MLFFKTQFFYTHSWDKVTCAVWSKYPNPFASHVLSSDVIERRIDENGHLVTVRLFKKKGKLPEWGKTLLSLSEEISTVNPTTKEMKIMTRNLSHKKLLLVEETQTITCLDPSNRDGNTIPKSANSPLDSAAYLTQVLINVRFISNTSFTPIRSQIEGWGLSRFKANTINSSKDSNSSKSNSNSTPSSRIGSGKSTTSSFRVDSSNSSRPQSGKSARSRQSDTSSQSLGSQMIQPWQTVKSIIARILGPKVVAALSPPTPIMVSTGAGSTAQHIEFIPSAALSPEEAKQNAHNTPITLSHGFQPIRVMETAKPGIKQVCYLPNSSNFVSLDKEFLQMWKGGVRIKKIPIIPPPIMSNESALGSKFVDGFMGVTKWIYIDMFRIYIVANQQLELKVINLNFKTISVASTPKPILFMEFCEKTRTVICGEIGGVRIYRIQKVHVGYHDVYMAQEQLKIEAGLEEEWVSFVYYENRRRCLYAGCGSSVFVFDYETGEKIDSYLFIHQLSITCISFYEPAEYLITGAKDGTIKVWNVRKSLLFDFHDHYNAITGIMLVENICGANWGSLPLIVSASLDCTIRMWNIETGQALYRVETALPCLGLRMIKKNLFYHFTESSIQLWNFNRFHHTFAVLLSKAVVLKKYSLPGQPARLLSAASDGSIRLLSVLSGTNLGTGFPTNQELTLFQVEYDVEQETIYALNTNGTIVVYDATVNPFLITCFWDNSRVANREEIRCIAGADLYNYQYGSAAEIDDRLYQRGELLARYILFGGTHGGQIHRIVFEKDREKQIPINQAHSDKITMLFFDLKRVRLISGAQDGSIKVWNIHLDYKKSSTITTNSEKRLDIRLSPIVFVNMESFDSYPSSAFALSAETEQIGMHCHGELFIASYEKNQTLRPHGVESQGSAKIISVVTTPRAMLWAANYDDASVKVWDSKGVLIRDIQFNENVTCVCFANERGDLLVGLSNEINLVRIQDYIPPHFLKQMYHLEYDDDVDEFPLAFNQDLDIWEFQKEEKPADENVSAQQQRNQENVFNMNFDELMELSRIRREEATRRKNKREFIAIEKNIYKTEMTKRAEMVKAKAAKLLHKEEPVIPIIVVADLEDKDVPEMEVRKSIAYVDGQSSSSGERKKNGTAKTKAFMERFIKEEPLLPSNRLLDRSRASSANNPRKVVNISGKRPKKVNPRKGFHESMESLMENDHESDSQDGSDSVDSFILEGPEDESGISTPISDIGFHNFLGEIIDEEEHHRDLIDASAKEFEMIVQAHDEELRLKRLKDLADKQARQKKMYQAGMTLPNSMGISNVLDSRRGSRALVKNEQLFRKADLEEMYIDRPKNSSSAPPAQPTKPRPKITGRSRSRSEPSRSMSIVPQPITQVEAPIVEETIKEDEEPEMDEQAILASIVGTRKKIESTPDPVVEPIPEPITRKKTIHQFDYDWNQSPENTSSVTDKLNSLAPLQTFVKQRPKPFEMRKPSIYSNLKEEEEVIAEKPQIVTPLGKDATKKLIHMHGLDESDVNRAASPENKKSKKKSKKGTISSNFNGSIPELIKEEIEQGLKKKKKTADDQVVFEPSKYVKMENSLPDPILNKRRKPTQIKDEKRVKGEKADVSKPNTANSAGKESGSLLGRPLQKPPSPHKKGIELKPFFPKGKVFARRNSVEDKDTVRPILDLLSDVNVPLDTNITIENISSIVKDQLKVADAKKTLVALDALVSLHRMFSDDIAQDKRFDTFVAPLLDSFLSDDVLVRKRVINCIVDMGIRHDSSLTLLICALNERDKSIVQCAIKGLANYGIADKEGLKRGMIELGMMKGTTTYSTNEDLEKIALKVKREAEKARLYKNRIVSEWINQTPITPPSLNRNDSYLDTLAGPFFPPDAHDFNAKQQALVMAAEANAGYDQYWKKKFMEKLNTDDEPFTWSSLSQLKNEKVAKPQGPQPPTVHMITDNSSHSSSKPPINRTTGKIKGSPAHFALVMSRALGNGGLPSNVVFPKIKVVERPRTVFNPTIVPTVTIKTKARPYTSVELNAHEKRMQMLNLKLTGNQRPKSVAATKRPKSPIKPGAFWLSAFKSKATASKSNASGLDSDSDEDDRQDRDSIDISTTISTINIDDLNDLDQDEEEVTKMKDSEAGEGTSAAKLPIPQRQPAAATIANSVKAWASPLKKKPFSATATGSTPPAPLLPVEPDENSTEFEIHIADSSLLVPSSSDQNLTRPESPTTYDFLPKRSQIPRSPFRKTAPLFPLIGDNGARSFKLPSPKKEADVERTFTQSYQESPPKATSMQADNTKNDLDEGSIQISAPVAPAPAKVTQPSVVDEQRYQDQNTTDQYKETRQDLIDEYEARLQFAKQESRSYIINLRRQLDLAESRVASLEAENDELNAYRLDAESREDHLNGRFSELVLEFEQLQNYCYDREESEKAILLENERLQTTVKEMANDLELMSSRLDHTRKQSLKQEADFELFSKKIKSQQLLIAELQEEKDQIQASLRKAQYDPPTQPTEVILQDQLDKALFDIEALKLVVQDLTNENNLLLEAKETSPTKQSPLRTLNTQQSSSGSTSRVDDKWALPSEKDRSAFLKRMQRYEEEADESTSLSLKTTRIPLSSPIPLSTSTKNPSRIPSQSLRDLVKEQQEQQKDASSSVADYYHRKESLESRLRSLESEKKNLTFELSRVPSTGIKALKRQDELEALLDVIDSEMASTRRQMKDFGLF